MIRLLYKLSESSHSVLRMICKELDKIVVRNFATDKQHHYATRHLLFLKFICPAVASPHAFGVIAGMLPVLPPFCAYRFPAPPTSAAVNRTLILLSKTLQCLSTGTFSFRVKRKIYPIVFPIQGSKAENRESFMKSLTQVITTQLKKEMDQLLALFDDILVSHH